MLRAHTQSVSLVYAHMHTYSFRHRDTHTLRHSHTFARAHIHAHACTPTHSLTQAYAHIHPPHVYIFMYTHTCPAHPLSIIHLHTHSRFHIHSHKGTCTHSRMSLPHTITDASRANNPSTYRNPYPHSHVHSRYSRAHDSHAGTLHIHTCKCHTFVHTYPSGSLPGS